MPLVADLVLAASVTDYVERTFPLVLLAFGIALYVVRRRDRGRGPDEDDL